MYRLTSIDSFGGVAVRNDYGLFPTRAEAEITAETERRVAEEVFIDGSESLTFQITIEE